MPDQRQFTTSSSGSGPPGTGATQVLNVPGLGNSGALHWQSRWEQRYPWFERVELGLWHSPDRNIWVERLDRAIRAAGRPVILVAHSLGCLSVAWWAAISGQGYRDPVAGALLVAPADPERPGASDCIARFGPAPRTPLPFPSILVASRNDPHADFARSQQFARQWGSHLVDAGDAGHLNADSGLGDWPLGISLVDRLVEAASLRADADRNLAEAARFLSIAPDAAPAGAFPW
ncbi:alpha/beta hydrolase [Sandaracinobacter sp. RS1-74]|uniref:RBBP9/YdeN family alpha/beta hydrolase n=1 Tax=Sandaracinobacteroides sayramensis TaxID=2913411 RepID=UPI001EDADC70|nr:alpha/beta hydrolase [Sandaracinobacteroides sayramensis]MCG2839621.1 alpha/beta hydrolase [Sandaracinobacteroides sayramensis]